MDEPPPLEEGPAGEATPPTVTGQPTDGSASTGQRADDPTVGVGPPAAPASGGPPAVGPPAAVETELRTFLIADIRGYTTYTEEHGDEAAAALAGRFAALVREVVEGRQGFLLELRGDEALAVFTSARQALKAANELQRRQEIDALPRGIGIGLDAGEAIPIEGGFRGSALNLAARLCSQAGPGQIVASEAVIHLAARVDGLAYVDARTLRLKGLDEPVRAVTVVPEGRAPKRRRPAGGPPRVERRTLLGAGAVGLAAVLVGGLLWAGPLGGLGQAASPGPSSGAAPSPTATPSVAPGAVGIETDDLPLAAFLDPATGDVSELLDEPRGAADAIFADGSFWVFDRQPRAIHQVDPGTGRSERPIAIGFEVGSYTVGDGQLFVAEPDGPIHVFDIASRREIVSDDPRIPIPFGTFIAGAQTVDDPNPIWDLAYGDGSLWVAGGWAGDLVRLDPATGGVQAAITTVTSGHYGVADGVAFADDVVWVSDSWSGQVLAVDPMTNAITSRTDTQAGIGPITAGGGSGWVADGTQGTVTRFDELGQQTAYSVGAGIAAIAYDAVSGTVWTASLDGGVASVDGLTGRVVPAYLGHSAVSIAANDGRVIAGLTRSPAEVIASVSGTILRISTEEYVESTDPASWTLAAPFAEATCGALLQRRVEPGSDGELLEPLVAAAMPEVSEDGRTYTFTIRDGFAFAPPSGEPLTAATYKASIERAVVVNRQGALPILDIAGYFDLRDGRADEMSGITVEGDRLSIRLGAPSPTFLERLSLPVFCPVPIGTPTIPSGPDDPPIPGAGPFSVTEHAPGEVLILERNPNYPMPTDAGFDAIAHFTERGLGRAIGRWERGELDIVAGTGPELRVGSRTDQRWGTGSEAADADSGTRLVHRSSLALNSLVVNAGSEAMADPNVRRALTLALDRPALSTYWGVPSDEVMPLSMPGLVQEDRGPLDGPQADEARALLGDRTVELVVVWASGVWCTECPALGDALERQLEAVGFSVTFVVADDPIEFANYQDSGYDLVQSYVGVESPDAAWWVTSLLREADTSGGSNGAGFPLDWVPDDIAAERDRLDDLEGRERRDAALALAERVADELHVIPITDNTYPQLISETVGCQRFRAGTPWLDLIAACPG
jgi:class 3 adenylate cyclase/ABC-type transport system substrate-binding protein